MVYGDRVDCEKKKSPYFFPITFDRQIESSREDKYISLVEMHIYMYESMYIYKMHSNILDYTSVNIVYQFFKTYYYLQF